MKIKFSVDRIRPDQRQYRQTEVELVPLDLLHVEIEIPDHFEVEQELPITVISLAGLKEIVSQCDLVFMGSSRPQKIEDDVEWSEEE